MSKEFYGFNPPYVEFKLGRDGMTFHSIPEVSLDFVAGCARLTP